MLKKMYGRKLWIMDESGATTPVNTHKDIQDRKRGQGIPDWWVVAKDADWTPPRPGPAHGSLLSMGAAAAASGVGGAGGGYTKTGAGGKPQEYGWHGYYGSAGAGVSGGNEVRGKVTPPPAQKNNEQKPPSPLSKGGRVVATTKNDDARKPDPNPEALPPKTREQVQGLLDKDFGSQDVNMNSGYRSGDPTAHGEGRAVDINQVNGQKVSDSVNPNVPADQREAMKERLNEIRAAAGADKEVEAYIDPLDGFFRPTDSNSKGEGRMANDKEKHDHRHHIHITIRK